jgi:hypothetical protein
MIGGLKLFRNGQITLAAMDRYGTTGLFKF